MHSRVLSLYDVHDTDARTRQRTLFQYVRGGSSRAADQAARQARPRLLLCPPRPREGVGQDGARRAARGARLAHLKDDNEYLRNPAPAPQERRRARDHRREPPAPAQVQIVVSYGYGKPWPKHGLTRFPASWKYVGYEGALKSQPAGVTNRAYFVGDRADAARAARSIRALFEKYRKKGYVTCFSLSLRRATRRSQRRGAAAAVK